jgi:hypothetical protein
MANLSLSLLDNDIVPKGKSDIITYLFLQSEVKGTIEQPKMYFDPTNSKRHQQLDLLLLTQGWRSFIWRTLADTIITKKYKPEQNFSISGRVRQLFINNPISNRNVSMLIAPKTNLIMVTKTDSSGRFNFSNLQIFGTNNLIITSKNKRNKIGGFVMLDKFYERPLPISKQEAYQIDTTIQQFSVSIEKQNNSIKQNMSNGIMLKEITVKGQHRTATVEDTTLKGSTPPLHLLPEDKDETVYHNLLYYLLDNVPRLHYTYDSIGQIHLYTRISGDIFPVDLQIPGENMMYISTGQLLNLSMKHIQKIDVKYRIHLGQGNQGGIPYIIVIPDPDALDVGKMYKVDTKIDGYYQAREFYVLKYAKDENFKMPDYRHTVYWEPNITTNANGEAEVRFYNGDNIGKIRIEAEGVSNSGPLRGIADYTVKNK